MLVGAKTIAFKLTVNLEKGALVNEERPRFKNKKVDKFNEHLL